MNNKDKQECAWCGKTYGEHVKHYEGRPLPRVPCLLSKSGFVPKDKQEDLTEDPFLEFDTHMIKAGLDGDQMDDVRQAARELLKRDEADIREKIIDELKEGIGYGKFGFTHPNTFKEAIYLDDLIAHLKEK